MQLGQEARLSCSAEGFPPPRYKWLQKLPNGEVLVRGYESELVLESVSYEHQGEFVCQVTNSVREKPVQSETVRVKVEGKPQLRRNNLLAELVTRDGQDTVLAVEFCGSPEPVLSWHLGGGLNLVLAAGTRHGRFVAEESEAGSVEDCYMARLRIMGAHPTDSRDYKLHLENKHGQEDHVVKLHVIDRAVSQEVFIAIVVGAVITVLVILLLIVYLVKADKCCGKKKAPKNYDLER